MIKQGSVLGSGISALTIDSLTRIIEEHGKVWEIGGIKINPLLFQDDIFAVNKTEDIQETISIIETFQNLKRLQFHEEKTKKSIINGKKDKTVYINGIEIERTKSHKYLGKIIEENGKIKEEIKERIKIAKMQVNQAFQVIDKNELSRKRIEVGIKLLQAVIMPTLIFGAETWNKLTEKEKTEINNVQTTFLSRLLRVPKTTPKCALIHETNSTKVEHLANQRKLEYYIDLHNREETRLEVRIRKYQEETNMSYEKEIEELKKLYKIEDNLKKIEKREGKNSVKKAIEEKNKEELKEQMSKGKKTQSIVKWKENYMEKLNFEDAKTIFKLRTNMIETKANYSNGYKGQIICDQCKVKEETTQHLFECNKYEDIHK